MLHEILWSVFGWTKHSRDLLKNALKEFLDGSVVASEGTRHIETPWWDVTDCSIYIIVDSFNKIAAVQILSIQDLILREIQETYTLAI